MNLGMKNEVMEETEGPWRATGYWEGKLLPHLIGEATALGSRSLLEKSPPFTQQWPAIIVIVWTQELQVKQVLRQFMLPEVNQSDKTGPSN